MHHGLRVVAVYMEDRRINTLGDVRGVGRGAGKAGRRGEADLIVDDEMQRAASAVPAQAGEAQTFGNHALAGEGGVSMQQERQPLLSVLVMVFVLLLSYFA